MIRQHYPYNKTIIRNWTLKQLNSADNNSALTTLLCAVHKLLAYFCDTLSIRFLAYYWLAREQTYFTALFFGSGVDKCSHMDLFSLFSYDVMLQSLVIRNWRTV